MIPSTRGRLPRPVLYAIILILGFLAGVMLAPYLVHGATTGPGQGALTGPARDNNFTCLRDEAGQCLPEPDIPQMPYAGGGGAALTEHPADSRRDTWGYIEPDQEWVLVIVIIAGLIGLVAGICVARAQVSRRA